MMLVRDIVQDAAIGVGIANQPENLSAIHQPGCAAAIWRRQLLPDLRDWVSYLPPNHLPKGRVILHRDAVMETVHQLCEIASTPDDAERDLLLEDIVDLSQIFAHLMNSQYLRLRLDVVTSNACRKFHVDAVPARMVCTYRGPGTQYGISMDGNEPQSIFTVPTGAPILLRGAEWPTEPKTGLMHRSPPIEGTGLIRLVFVLDPVFDADSKPNSTDFH